MQCDIVTQKTICRCKNLTLYLVFYGGGGDTQKLSRIFIAPK